MQSTLMHIFKCTLKPWYNEPEYSEFCNIAPILRIYWAYYIWYSEYSIYWTKRVWWTCLLYRGLSVLPTEILKTFFHTCKRRFTLKSPLKWCYSESTLDLDTHKIMFQKKKSNQIQIMLQRIHCTYK